MRHNHPHGPVHSIHSHQHHIGWNNSFPPVAKAAPGDVLEFACLDPSCGQITPDWKAADLARLDFGRINPTLGPIEIEHLAALSQRGYRFSIDHVTDLRIEPRELADRGVRFIKVPAALLLDPKQSSASDIHPSDLSDLLGRFGIDLIAEKIEGERAVVDLLDYDVRFGQGFLFAPPRPLRPEGASATGGATPTKESGPSNASTPAPTASQLTQPPVRATGNAALARRAAGPG